uniref:Uncharacterized protein n=1 Tax=Trieres chinensis TaxID=1514140 RepID=A0A7S1YZM1_TRICV
MLRSAALCLALATTASVLPRSRAFSSTARGGPPSWSDLEARLPSALVPGPAVYGVGEGPEAADLKGKTVLYRDSNGWCPHSEQAWLALLVWG